MDVVVYPSLRRAGLGVQPIFRIWLGFMVASLAMIYSAILQYYIYHTNPCGEFVGSCAEPSTISIWAQVPCYVSAFWAYCHCVLTQSAYQVLIAIAEIFASITSLEYSYNMAPKRMKSVVMSIFMLTSAAGSVCRSNHCSISKRFSSQHCSWSTQRFRHSCMTQTLSRTMPESLLSRSSLGISSTSFLSTATAKVSRSSTKKVNHPHWCDGLQTCINKLKRDYWTIDRLNRVTPENTGSNFLSTNFKL